MILSSKSLHDLKNSENGVPDLPQVMVPLLKYAYSPISEKPKKGTISTAKNKRIT